MSEVDQELNAQEWKIKALKQEQEIRGLKESISELNAGIKILEGNVNAANEEVKTQKQSAQTELKKRIQADSKLEAYHEFVELILEKLKD